MRLTECGMAEDHIMTSRALLVGAVRSDFSLETDPEPALSVP